MRIYIFGGTTEGRLLSQSLADAGADVTISVVSEYGAQQQGEHPGVSLHVGPMTEEEMADMLEAVDLVIDATHPYATRVTENIRAASGRAGVPVMRLCREEDISPHEGEEELFENAVRARDREEAADLALEISREKEGRILLTTGVKDLPYYCEKLDVRRVVARVLPSEESIAICMRAGLDPHDIIAIQGPFSARLNEALIREYGIVAMITKESGSAGGFREKLQACADCGITAVCLRRPPEDGMKYEEVERKCLRLISQR